MRLLNAVRGEKAAQNEVEDRYFPRRAPRVSGDRRIRVANTILRPRPSVR